MSDIKQATENFVEALTGLTPKLTERNRALLDAIFGSTVAAHPRPAGVLLSTEDYEAFERAAAMEMIPGIYFGNPDPAKPRRLMWQGIRLFSSKQLESGEYGIVQSIGRVE